MGKLNSLVTALPPLAVCIYIILCPSYVKDPVLEFFGVNKHLVLFIKKKKKEVVFEIGLKRCPRLPKTEGESRKREYAAEWTKMGCQTPRDLLEQVARFGYKIGYMQGKSERRDWNRWLGIWKELTFNEQPQTLIAYSTRNISLNLCKNYVTVVISYTTVRK